MSGLFVDFLAREVRLDEAVLVEAVVRESGSAATALEMLGADRSLAVRLEAFFRTPPPLEGFSETLARVRRGEGQAPHIDPGWLGSSVSLTTDADWAAVTVPVFTADELDFFIRDWPPMVSASAGELRFDVWWEAMETVDGRWALLPQDRFPMTTVTLPLLIGYSTRVVFERLPVVVPPGMSAALEEQLVDAEQWCRLEGDVQEPNRPYIGSCRTRRCPRGCQPLTGTGSGGRKVLLACGC